VKGSEMDIIMNNEWLINSIISKYTNYYDKDDLYQVAVLGIIKATRNFKDDFKTKFSTYAYTYVLGEVLKYINNSYSFKVNREILTLNKKINEARAILSQKNMREASNKEVAMFLEIEENIIFEVENNIRSIDSLNREIEEDGKKLFLEDTISDQKDNFNIDNILLYDMIKNLSKEEQNLVYQRYFEDRTQSEIAKNLGINQVQVSRNEKKILKKMHENYRKIRV